MSEMRDGLETAEQAIYESLGLTLPGTVALAGSVCVLAPDGIAAAASFASAHPWLTLAACYVAGYPVQSLSRPIDKAVVFFPCGACVWLVRRVNPAWAEALLKTWRGAGKWLQRGHKLEPEAERPDDSRQRVRLADLEHAHWHARFGLKADQRLDALDVKNLSFSTLGPDQRRLHRFRAIASLNRAMAAIAGVALWVGLYVNLRWGHGNLTGLAIAAGCAVLFVAFRERANMYDGLWNSIIGPQYLANKARTAPAEVSVATPTTTSATLSLTAGGAGALPTKPFAPLPHHDENGSVPRLDDGDLRA